MNRIALIVPGFRCPTKNGEYQQIARFFRKRGIKPILIEIEWNNNTHERYVQQFNKQFQNHVSKNDQVYMLGFSFGAMIACMVAPEINPEAQILCSLSPFFKEDLPNIKSSWIKYNGKNRQSVFEKLSFANIAKKTKCKTFILAGDKEGIEVERRAVDANKKIKNSELIFLDGVRHNIADERYLKKIGEIIKNFN